MPRPPPPAPRRPPRAVERSSRSPTRRPSRSASTAIVSSSSRRSSSLKTSVSLRSAPIAVVIPVSGERRSWETARSSAVFTRSLRRSVSASSASCSSRLRSNATASSAASAGRNRWRTARFGVGVGRDVERADGSTVDLERDRCIGAAALRRPELDLGARRCRARRPPASPTQPSSVSSGWPPSRCAGDLGEQRRLTLALLGVRGPPP